MVYRYLILTATIDSGKVSFDVAWSADCVDKRCFDYSDIAESADFVFVMVYDTRSQIFGDCVAWANSALNNTVYGLNTYLKLGIPDDKLVLGIPWYGYIYPCINYTQDNKCYIRKVPFRGVACSDAAGSQKGYSDIINSLLPNSTTGRLWDDVAKSPYFTYKDPQTGQPHQVWYDDPVSLEYKYNLAAVLGLRGVGMWEADDLDYSDDPKARQQTAMMWAALPDRL